MGDARSLAHTKGNCKYRIAFALKYRRQVFYGARKRAIGEISRKLCEGKILEAESCPCRTQVTRVQAQATEMPISVGCRRQKALQAYVGG